MALINLDKVLEQLAAYGEGAEQGMAAALFQEGETIMAKSKEVYVPVDTGALKASGRVDPPETGGDRIVVVLSYGGDSPAGAYAVPVHEDPYPFHQPPTQYKYLERPVQEAIPGMPERIGDRAVATAKRSAGI